MLMVCAIADYFAVTTDELLGRAREVKKLVVIASETDRKQVEKIMHSHGFCTAAWAEDFESANRLREKTGALCVHRVSTAFMTEAERQQTGHCSYGDCVYEEPEDLPGNLDTILSMMEKHF